MGSFLKIRRIDNIIVKNDHLIALRNKITHLVTLKKRILSTLAEPPPCDFTVIEFAQTSLKLSVNQAGFASRLRFLAPDWVQQLRQADPEFWCYLAQIKIQISPGQTNQPLSNPEQVLTSRRNTPGRAGGNKLGKDFTRPSPLSDAKSLLSSQYIDDAPTSQFLGKSATMAKGMPTKAKSHELRKLIYESSLGDNFSLSSRKAARKKANDNQTITKNTSVRQGLKPDPMNDSSELDAALERLWQHVYDEK